MSARGERIRDEFTGEEWVRGPGGTLRRPCPDDCVDGYRPVGHLYAAGIADPDEDPAMYAAALNSVYPCSSCNGDVYAKWERGCTRPEHLSIGGCEECRPRKAARR